MTVIVPTGLNITVTPRARTSTNSSADAIMRARTGTGRNVKARVLNMRLCECLMAVLSMAEHIVLMPRLYGLHYTLGPMLDV